MRLYGPYVGARTLREGRVPVLRGVDRVTGIPVLIFLLPALVDLPVLNHPSVLPYTDVGEQGGQLFAVSVLPPSARPLTATPDLPRRLLEAVEYLHARGLVHGGLDESLVFSVGDEVVLAGVGLPWGPPDEPATVADDLLGVTRVLERHGGLPAALAPLRSPDADARGTAREALERLARADAPAPLPEVEDAVVLVAPPGTPDTPTTPRAPEPLPLDELEDVPVVSSGVMVADDPPSTRASVLSLEIDDVYESTPPSPTNSVSGAPAARVMPTRPVQRASGAAASPRQQTIRIGWEEDHSWRVVKSVPEPTRGRPRRPSWPVVVPVAVVLAAVAAWAALRPAPDVPCCDVEFRVTGAPGTQAVLSVLDAPEASGLEAGKTLGVIPGTIDFPDVPGEYRLRVQAQGYSAGTLVVRLPRDQTATIELVR